MVRMKANKEARRKRKTQLKALMNKVNKKRQKNSKPQRRAMDEPGSVRTTYEKIYESYCKLLGQPYLINQVFCFTCKNYYWFGDNQSYPKRCQVCSISFLSDTNNNSSNSEKETTITKIVEKGNLSRPDFILDFNSNEDRLKYRQDTQHHRIGRINNYQPEYLKKVAIIRIDGGVHDKYHVQKRDYWQYIDFRNSGIKVFIVRNEDIDELLDKKDNGKSILELCKMIGDATLDEELYNSYSQGFDFLERTKRPFKL